MEFPYQSYLFYLLLTLIVVFFDPYYFLHYLLAGLIAILIYNHPSFGSYCRELAVIFNVTDWVSEL